MVPEIVPFQNPFDKIRREDHEGEHWTARDLVSPLSYTWRRLVDAIERARTAFRVNGQDPDIHIRCLTTPSNDRSATGRAETRTDYRLTREGVYATIQGGDPRKPEIAAGWAYFRQRTRQAELAPQASAPKLDPDLQRIFDLTVGMQQTRDEVKAIEAAQQQMASELQGVADDVADLKALSPISSKNMLSLRDAARAVTGNEMGQNRFKRWLLDKGILFTDHQRHDRLKQTWVNDGLGIERWEPWANGQGMAWVPYFNAIGVAKLRRTYMADEDGAIAA